MSRSTDAVMKYEKAVDQYIKNCQAIGLSKTTLNNYITTLSNFYGFFSDDSAQWKYQDPSFTTIQAYRNELTASGAKKSTVGQRLMELRIFFNWASGEEGPQFYEKNPVSAKLSPKRNHRPYDTILTNEQIAKLWRYDYPITYMQSRWDRNYALVVLLLTSKIRVSEALAVTPADLDWENGEIEVEHGKGDKYRVAPFPKIAQQAVQFYLKSGMRNPSLGDSDTLFDISDRGTLSRAVESHVRYVTGVNHVRSHDLRHIGSYLDLNAGKPLEELQAELGHNSPVTTQIYSGRLTARKNRGDVKGVFEEMEYQISRNDILLKNRAG